LDFLKSGDRQLEEEEDDLLQHEEATKHGGVKDNIEIKVPDTSFMDRKFDSVKDL